MPAISLLNLSKTYRVGRQAVIAVDEVSLLVPDGKIVTLLGPSGCGKSTTMRCIAGLERPDDGEILFGQRVIFSRARRVAVPPDRRNVGMVFQSYAIWPHLTVSQNVAYPLEVRGLRTRQVTDRVREVLALVGLSGLEDRPAPYLSGGQQQRVALARALVYEPEVLLLDEPLSNLDAKIREQVREEFHSLQRRLGITALYVTHDQLEALVLSDVIAVMHQGRIMELGTPQELYARPRNPFTASFLGEISYLNGTVSAINGEMATVTTTPGPLQCSRVAPIAPGSKVVAGVRPEHVILMRDRPAALANVFEGIVLSALYEGTRVKYRIDLGDLTVLAYGSEVFPVGARLHASIDADRVILLPDLAH
ncbi:MAG: ABC transporter ATP-binding protein [Armatimonadetes bacterium]|nr:ABC transporter ATP-binding protein [Armatimonadota bacterium]